jgi:hypothetical protein
MEWVSIVAGTAAVGVAAYASTTMPTDNPRELSRINTTALYVIALSLTPFLFRSFGGEPFGIAFASSVLLLHLLTITGKHTDLDRARMHASDLRNSSATMTGLLTTFAFLIAALRNEKTFYHQSSRSASAWMTAMLFGIVFILPELPFDPQSSEAYAFRQFQTIMLSYSLGFFVSGIVLAHRA